MNDQPDLVSRIQILDKAVANADSVPNDGFRSALCELIRAIPKDWESQARDLCLDESSPIGATVIEQLQHDIDAHSEDLDHAMIFCPLMRLAVAIRTAELRFSVQ